MFRPGVFLKSVIDMVMCYNFDTSLLLFLLGHIYMHVNSDWMFFHFGKVVMTNVT